MKICVLTTLTLAALFAITPALASSNHEVLASANRSAAVTQRQPNDRNPNSKVEIFTGKIAKAGAAFVLQDAAMNATFRLDDQTAASKFVGKNVRIMGTLDASNNIIYVQTIEVS
ncbi:MAG TPA: DUF5818 domain-containing protein [Candidatus Acidoferrum sp.]|nr:DUF5818 domain-containing protein [Candidatus Acidoferrum sp.]